MTDQSLDDCLSLLGDRCRREAIRQLRDDATDSTTIDDLVDGMCVDGRAFGDAEAGDREELATRLHHTSVPKLEAHGVVEHDHRSGDVVYRSNERVEAILDSLPDETPVTPLEN